MQVELRRIQREVGITTIFVTHDQEEAMTLSDRIAIMNQGKIEQLGAPLEVYEHPINRFAAGFLGVANFLEGRVASISGGAARIDLKLGGQAAAPAQGFRQGDAAVLAVRPEKISVEAGTGEPGVNRLGGTVISAIFSGSSTTYRIQVGDQIIAVFQQNSAPRRFQADDTVTLQWSPEHNVPVAP
jgi:ABC-type Fe3+/spermidine/putrescine transport system ATPase subunit